MNVMFLISGVIIFNLIFLVLPSSSYSSVPPPVCVYGQVDVQGRINQVKKWMETEIPNGRKDDWWIAIYLATSNFNIEDTESHLKSYYDFKKSYLSVTNQRNWFIKYIEEGGNDGMSEEDLARKSNEGIVQLLHDGVVLPLMATNAKNGIVVLVRLSQLGNGTYKELITIFSFFWDLGLDIASPAIEGEVEELSKLVCQQGKTLPISATTPGCNHLQTNKTTQPNPNDVPSLLQSYFAELPSPLTIHKFATEFFSGSTVIVDLAGIPNSMIPDLVQLVPALVQCLLIYPLRLHGLHFFANKEQQEIASALEFAIQDNSYLPLSVRSQIISKVFIHNDDYSILDKCGIKQSELPKEYGGSAGTVSDLTIFWETVIPQGVEIYKHENTFT